MKLLPGTSSTELGKNLATTLKIPLIELKSKNFSDGETYIKIDGPVEKQEVLLVQNTSPPQEKNLLELMLIASTLKELGADKVHSIVPYLCYARSDRRRLEGEVTSHQITLDLIYKSGIDSLITINVHNPDVFLKTNENLKKYNIDSTQILIPKLRELADKDWYLVGPDKGSYNEVKNVAQGLSSSFDTFEKYRDPITHKVTLTDTGFDCKAKDVVLIDDAITSGGTAFDAIELLKQKNPSSITYFVVHALSKKEVFDNMMQVGVTDIFSTNTIPRTDIKQLDITAFLGKFIEETFL
ncbi:MAG: ribose-phosphate diphosphokinase [Promethearchaeota archaeon]|jgi:ribose-phosphate pyrophosphokinase